MKLAVIAALLASSAVAEASLNYEPETRNEFERVAYNLPEGVEFATIPTKYGICGDTALVLMDAHGYRILCGGDTFKHPALGRRDACFGELLEHRAIFTNAIDKWTDKDCDGIADLYEPANGENRSYLDIMITRLGGGSGIVDPQLIQNAADYEDAVTRYIILREDMNYQKARELWEASEARRSLGGEQ